MALGELFRVRENTIEDEIPIPVREVSEAVREDQVARLDKIKRQRDQALVQKILNDITSACESGQNLLEVCLSAVRARATVGEICDTMEKV